MSNRRRTLVHGIRAALLAGAVAAVPGHGASAGLAAELQKLGRETGERVWLSYAVPMLDGRHGLCCYNEDEGHGRRRLCALDGRSFSGVIHDDKLADPDRRLRVYLGLEGGQVVHVRAYDTQCAVDLRRGRVQEISGIDPADSVAWLSAQIRAGHEQLRDGAMLALAFHAHPAAAAALTAATRTGEPVEIRSQAAFWLGTTRAEESFETLRRMVQQDPSAEVREQAIFALSLGDHARATALLFELARQGDDAGMRGQALFWLGQKAGERVVELLRDAAFDDPELEVKEQAVFALSQLPDGAGVTRLIEVATSHAQPEVRRAALFWLGESGDPRALDLFERLLE